MNPILLPGSVKMVRNLALTALRPRIRTAAAKPAGRPGVLAGGGARSFFAAHVLLKAGTEDVRGAKTGSTNEAFAVR